MTINTSRLTIPNGFTAGAALLATNAYLAAPELFYSGEPEPVTRAFPFDHTAYATLQTAAVAAGNENAVNVGLLVGYDTASSNVKPYDATVGTMKLLGVIAAPIDALQQTTTDVMVPVFVHGYFNIDALIYPAADNTDTLQLAVADAATMFNGSVLLFGKGLYAGIVTTNAAPD